MKRFGFTNLPSGFLVGKAKLTDVKYYKNENEHIQDKNLHLATSFWGNKGFILENPTELNL
jgi:hypothetical protein